MMNTYPSDIELANACQDLTSWVLQDDLIFQDFCQEAKETPSQAAGVLSYVSSPFITMPDETMEMPINDSIFNEVSPSIKKEIPQGKESHPLFFDHDFELQALMREEISYQQELDKQQFIKEQEELEQLVKLRELELKREQDEKSVLQQFNLVDQPFNNNSTETNLEHEVSDFKEIVFEEEVMDVNTELSNDDGIYYIEEPTVINGDINSSSPYIISVPVSEAYQQQNEETFSIVSDLSELSGYQTNQKAPKPFIINLKRVSIPNKSCEIHEPQPSIVVNSPEPSVPEDNELTLKDILETESADEVIRDFLQSPSPSSVLLSPRSDDGSVPSSSFSDAEYSPASPLKKTRKTYSSIEKKLRKKEQNKRAALRYRQKKKEEEDALESVYRKEQERSRMLQAKRNEIILEIKCMTKLAKDMIAARKRNSS